MSNPISTDKLLQDLHSVVREAESLLKATAGHAGDKVDEVRARAEKTVREARSRLDEVEQHTLRRVRDAATEAEGYVRDNPWQALGVAAGVGLLLGLLLGRRS